MISREQIQIHSVSVPILRQDARVIACTAKCVHDAYYVSLGHGWGGGGWRMAGQDVNQMGSESGLALIPCLYEAADKGHVRQRFECFQRRRVCFYSARRPQVCAANVCGVHVVG